MSEAAAFSQLALPHHPIPSTGSSRYKVFKDAGQYIVVAAESAVEAARNSGIGDVFKIERDNMLLDGVIDKKVFFELPPAAVNQVAPTSAPADPIPAPADETSAGEVADAAGSDDAVCGD